MRPSPRVRCGGCAFEWFGATAAHGLRIVGSCPKCGGGLDFLVAEEEERATPASDALHKLAPAAVLGRPMSWAR
jgi:hypothetical protein